MFNKKNSLAIGVIALILLRAFLNAYIPFFDKTEARYAEIARIMQETGNWITPQIDYGVPFWAKPPLSTWFSAISIQLFGVNEFAVRFPYLIASIILIIIVSKFVQQKKAVFLIGFILLTIPEFLLHAGVVSTDTMLSFCIAMIFLGFWKTMNQEKTTIWSYIIFVFIGFGLLAKGPIVLILTVPPIVLWVIYFSEYRKFFKKIPIFTGTLLALVIAFPWYYLAEMKTEGFLEYFIIGEHFKRFVDSSWQGDKYGFAKIQPLGMIWLFLLAFAFPWIQILLIKLWKHKKNWIHNKWVIFLLLWLIWTPFFFTFSSSLIHPYILPSLVPIALLIVYFWEDINSKKAIFRLSLFFPVIIFLATIVSFFGNTLEYYGKTDKFLIQKTQNDTTEIYYLGEKSYSSQFYSQGKVKNISFQELEKKINSNSDFHILIKNKDLKLLDTLTTDKLILLDKNKFNGIYKIGSVN